MLDDTTADLVASGLVQAASAGGGFILDCRGVGGTNLACVDSIAGHFTEPDVFLYAVQDGAGEDLDLHAAPPKARAGVPVLMLTDGDTTGVAELLASLFARPRGVLLVGASTRGDPARREMVPLADGRFVFLATGRFVRPDGTDWRGRGIVPHVVVSPGSEARPEIRTNITSRTGRPLGDIARRHLELFARLRGDPVLARAVELLLGLKALAILPENPHAPVPPAAENR
jgi:C-terminal processing protease CtpA/Prc